MFEIWCITERSRCGDDFLFRLQRTAQAKPDRVILREKDLSPQAYRALAETVLPLCRQAGVPCSLHTFSQEALYLGVKDLHLPLPLLRTLPQERKESFPFIGTSCHSPEEAEEAEALGADYLIAGHIFPTDCKPGLPPRGLDFLREICHKSRLPVYAIGGITPERIPALKEAGAAGACLMSSFRTHDPVELMKRLREA